ncbi:MAG: uroporphyrinogen decarboxylase family protein [Bdellovibrionota bacterium]
MNTKFQNAIQRKVQNTPPIWFMRQAGRYHSHYQALRKKYSFVELCKIPDIAAEVAFGPVNDFDFDVAILFSDILFPLEGLGMGLEYTDKGPRLGFQLDAGNIDQLRSADQAKETLTFQFDAMRATRARIPSDKSLIGFVGGPWTLFVYACEGGHAGSLTKTKSLINIWPAFQEKIKNILTWNIRGQLEAGAEVVMIFDTAAGEVDSHFFNTYLKPILTSLVTAFPGKVGYYSKGTQKHFFGQDFLDLPWAGRGVDHRCNLTDEIKSSKKGFLQGNFDQACLHMPTADYKKHLSAYIANLKTLSTEERAGWVSGLGHGVLPQTPEAHVRDFVNTIRKEFA